VIHVLSIVSTRSMVKRRISDEQEDINFIYSDLDMPSLKIDMKISFLARDTVMSLLYMVL